MHTLIVTEKPNVAERIANALGKAVRKVHKGVAYYEVGDNYVAPAVGHIYGLRQKKQKGWTYPVFEIEWVPSYQVNKSSDFTKKYLDCIQYLAKKSAKFINACDYDVEGEVIGYNVLKHGCGEEPTGDNVSRMKYSTLTKDSINQAFDKIGPIDFGLADAGLARHTLDWYWGINLSRALTHAVKKGGNYKTLSIGRVQGPTLKLLAARERSIKDFKAEKYWQVEMQCHKDIDFSSMHVSDKLDNPEKANEIKESCGDNAVVSDVQSKKYKQPAPCPFDLTTLQTEAYKHLKIDPRQTLKIAQDLYTNAYISYPRTSSQQIPADIDCKKILNDLMRQKDYSGLCQQLLEKKNLKPVKGKKKDAAHPAIHPTGEHPPKLDKQHLSVYDLIVRRFLAAFADPAVRQTLTVSLDNNGELFVSKGNTTVEKGWHTYYGRYAKFEETTLPLLEKEMNVGVKDVIVHEKETKPPKRYTPASIIRQMESKNIGTKATRSQIVDILFRRGYIDGKSLIVSDLGLKVIDSLSKYCPDVISEKLTRKFEDEMEQITEGKITGDQVVGEGRQTLLDILKVFKENEEKIGESLTKGLTKTRNKINSMGSCPECESALLIRKSKYGSSFIGCSNYPKCTLTWPLPPGEAKKGKECKECGFFQVKVKPKKGRQHIICINPSCPTKAHAEPELKAVGKCPKCGSELIVRRSRYGSYFIGCSGYPKCKNIWPLPKEKFDDIGVCEKCNYPLIKVSVEKGSEYTSCVNPDCEKHVIGKLEGPAVEDVGKCPKCSSPMIVRKSRFGTYFIGCSGYPKCKNIWPLPKHHFEYVGDCSKCGYKKIKVDPKNKDSYESCVNPDCENHKK